MGEALYAELGKDQPDIAHRTYAPVGSHRDLLAYLVRRLLENGANSSFVALAADETVPVKTLLRRPADIIGTAEARGIRTSPCRAISIGRSGKIRAASNSASARRSKSLRRPLPRKTCLRRKAVTARRPTLRLPRRARAFGAGAGRRQRRVRKSSNAPPTCWSSAPRISSRCCSARAARRWMTRSPRCARPPIFAATTPRKAEHYSATARRCRGRPAKATCL